MRETPEALRRITVIDSFVDLAIGIPLFLFPDKFLGFLGLKGSDILARVAAAAFLGLGIESFMGRNSGPETFLRFLSLKTVWSISIMSGLLLTFFERGSLPLAGWLLMGSAVIFNFIWLYWKKKLIRICYR